MISSVSKRALSGFGGFLLLTFFGLGAVAQATTYPYFKEYGADVSAGGWFNSGAVGCVGTQYQDSNYKNDGSKRLYGGILTYAKFSGLNANGGSSSQYGAYVLGDIDSAASSASSGFYSDGALASNPVAQLSFANSPALSLGWGGQFDGGVTSADQCVPDYFGTQQNNPTTFIGSNFDPSAHTGPQYLVTQSSGNFDFNSGGDTTIPAGVNGRNLTVFVSGNVYIGSNIIYAAHTASNVPKFALVVRGNIYIGPGVSRLDGWYIAEPMSSASTPSTNDGIIWTCHNNDSVTIPSSSFLLNSCGNKLTVNGALTAKHVDFTRTGGDVMTQAGPAEDSSSAAAAHAAEVINYTPEMVLGGPFFNASSTYNLNSLISLPPIF